MKPRSFILRMMLVALVLTAPSLWAQDGLRGALSRLNSSADLLSDPFAQRLVAADFDQDQQPDGAILLAGDHLNGPHAFRIELHLTSGENQKLSFTSSETALNLSVLDVNRDGTPDLVVEQTFTRKRVQIWLNDGHGSFRLAKSEDYPYGPQAPVSWRMSLPPVGFPSPCLSSRSGSENLALVSQPIPVPSHSAGQCLWALALLSVSKPRAPNPSRGPPSLLSL